MKCWFAESERPITKCVGYLKKFVPYLWTQELVEPLNKHKKYMCIWALLKLKRSQKQQTEYKIF